MITYLESLRKIFIFLLSLYESRGDSVVELSVTIKIEVIVICECLKLIFIKLIGIKLAPDVSAIGSVVI